MFAHAWLNVMVLQCAALAASIECCCYVLLCILPSNAWVASCDGVDLSAKCWDV